MSRKQVSDETLRKAHERKMTITQAAEVLGISRQAVSKRWKTLGLQPHRVQAPGTRGRIITLSVRPGTDRTLNVLARQLGLTRSAVVDRAVKMLMDSLGDQRIVFEKGEMP